jgi:hypothetical protein
MGWPFLWPVDEPWPVCNQRDPELLQMLEARMTGVEEARIDLGGQALPGLPSVRDTATNLMEKCREGHNVPYLPVLQLRRAEFPDLPFPDDADLFQLLWCPMIHFEGNGGFLLYWRQSSRVEQLRAVIPPQAGDFAPITPCSIDPETIPDYPDWREVSGYPPAALDEEDGDDAEKDLWQAMADLGPASGTKLFGFPRWEQYPDYPDCPKCGIRMKLLLSIASYEFCNGERNSRWIPMEDREVLEGADYATFTEYCEPHNLMIGDGGEAHLLFCRECFEFTSRVQCG